VTRTSRLAMILLALGMLTVVPPAQASAEAPKVTVTTLHFKVSVGPPGATQTCDVVGDVYRPVSATRKHPAPAVLTTNGFGGSKNDQRGMARMLASRGYVVLSYSGLGFGGSSCKITLDDPRYDGRAASQLISYLGGAPGIAFRDAEHTAAAPRLDVVLLDRRHDPRVGMTGGSYGGAVQLATASIDRRLDTIIPFITWNDLSYSLGPNNTAQTKGVSTRTPGAVKLFWGVGFTAFGVVSGLQNAAVDIERLFVCPNFPTFVCTALATAGVTGFFQPGSVADLRKASPSSYLRKVRIPVLLMQGQKDTLFNLNEAAATYRTLRAQGTPVKMVWQSWGHSGGAAPGEYNASRPDPARHYDVARVVSWFDHYLKGKDVDTGPRFAYFRDWVRYSGIATPAYATSDQFPVGTRRTWRLSGRGDLVTGKARPGKQAFLATPLPTSTSPTDAFGLQPFAEPRDLPGTFAAWATSKLTRPVDVVGSPQLTVRVQAPAAAATQAVGPAGQLVLSVKITDVGPNGRASLIHGLEAPIRIPDVRRPVTITLPAIVHRFAKGHRIRLVVSAPSENYRGGLVLTPVTVVSGGGQVLTLPVVR
jgi:dienelactone hydrolase